MARSIIMHIDEAPWTLGIPDKKIGQQMIGSEEEGPWTYVSSPPPETYVPLHSHSEDEVTYILEGQITVEDKACGPGTVIYNERGTMSGYTVGKQGVRMVNIRYGKSACTWAGGETYEFPDELKAR